MKNKTWLLLTLSLTVALNIKADMTNNRPFSDKEYANLIQGTAAVDTSTNVALLPANLVFFLVKQWNDVLTNQFRADEMICRVMTARRTNLVVPRDLDSMTTVALSNSVRYRYLVTMKQAFDFKLLDDNGREVPKTKKGSDFSQSPIPPKDAMDLNYHFKPGIAHWPLDDVHNLFRPSDMFVITNKGIYDLSIKVRICVPMTNGVPDTNAMTGDFSKFANCENFGVVESTPLRVKVIKE